MIAHLREQPPSKRLRSDTNRKQSVRESASRRICLIFHGFATGTVRIRVALGIPHRPEPNL
jgi:hypothetical protein